MELDTVFGKPRNYEFPRKFEATASLKATKNSAEPPNCPQLNKRVRKPEFGPPPLQQCLKNIPA